MTCVTARWKTRLTSLEGQSHKRPAFDIKKPENLEWFGDFYRRNLRNDAECSVAHISAEDQAEWSHRIKDFTLVEFIATLIEVRGMF